MKNAIIFGTGIIAGVVAAPVAIIYVKPVRRVFAKGVSSFFAYVVKEEAKKEDSEFLDLIQDIYGAWRAMGPRTLQFKYDEVKED